MENFKKVLKENNLVLVDFYASWCAPCHMMSPILADLKEALGSKIEILKVNIDDTVNHSLSTQFSIRSVPTLILFKVGIEVWRHSGVVSTADLRQLIEGQMKVM